MKILLRSLICLLIAFVLISSQSVAQQESDEGRHFDRQVLPILVGKCLECHGEAKKGGLDLRTRETALKGGDNGAGFVEKDADSSSIFEYVESEMMPPKHPLKANQIAAIKKWIDDGTYYPAKPLDPFSVTTDDRAGKDWWSLQPLKITTPPEIKGIDESKLQHWNKNAIDRFVLQRLRERGLGPNQAADPRTIIRRLSFDLTGLPPSRKEVAEFIKACEKETGQESKVGDQAYESLVDRLLASPRFGEHWGKHWLDVVRYGESSGFEVNHRIENIWPYRDYVINAINDDKPYDEFVKEQLAGDVIAPGNKDIEIATAFLVCGPYDQVGNQDKIQAARIRANTIDEMIRATTETFLGLTIGCARCHDHKFDPISQKDYHRLHASLASVFHADRPIVSQAERKARNDRINPLRKQQGDIDQQINAIEKAIYDRSEKIAKEIEKDWTRPRTDRSKTVDVFDTVKAKWVRLTALGRDDNPWLTTQFRIDEFEIWSAEKQSRNVALMSNGAKATGLARTGGDFDEAYAAERTIDGNFGERWIAHGSQLTIELANVESINRIIFSSDRSGSLQNHGLGTFLSEYRIDVSLDGKDWREIANSFDRKPVSKAHRDKRIKDRTITKDEKKQIADLRKKRNQLQQQINGVPGFPSWRIGQLRQTNGPFHVFIGGDPQKKGIEISPASLDVLSNSASYELGSDSPEYVRRMKLAEWIVSTNNPITPRVLANRLWHYHFGQGIVDTPSDFGFMGGRPTHSELLDWLANAIHQNDWKLKAIHKQIVMSQTYRQSSQFREAAARVDQNSRFLWRYPQRRLSAEQIRDAMLKVSGKLDLKMGGPGFRLYRYMRDNVSVYIPLDEFGPETYRRSVYHQHVRAAQVDLMTEYDLPDCSFSAPRRATTTTPLQALTMMNHSFTSDIADGLVARVQNEAKKGAIKEQVSFVFELMFSRKPNQRELVESTKLVKQHGMKVFCRAMLNLNEFVYLD